MKFQALSTVAGTTGNYFTPNGSQWRTDTVNLNSFAGQTFDVAFRNIGKYGNTLYIDDININGVITVGLTPTTMPVSQITVYPNPTTGELRIINYELGIKNVEVYNILGECVFKSEIINTESEINISSLSNGIYLLRITDNNNSSVYTQRVIKQ